MTPAAAILTDEAVDIALKYLLPLVNLGLNEDAIRTTVKGWSDSGMTLDQISEQIEVLRAAKRDAAVKA